MAVGTLARSLLGKHFHSVAKAYRAAFVNLEAVASVLDELLAPSWTVLDIGGGDGAPLNELLGRRSDLRIVMLDIASSIGGAVDPRYAKQVLRFPQTPLERYDGPRPDALLVMDVVHHIPERDRSRFFQDLAAVASASDARRIIVKDVGPGHIRSLMGVLADRYVSGDKNVRLAKIDSVTQWLQSELGKAWTITETRLRRVDPPNYCVAAFRE